MPVHREDSVWITGIGTATPLGFSFDELATNLLAGRSGVRPVTHFDPVDQPCRVAATMDPIPVPAGWSDSPFRSLGHWEQLLLWCGVAALHNADWWDRRHDLRIGLVIGLGSEWMLEWEADLHQGGQRIACPERDQTSLAAFLHRQLGLRGPVSTVAAACASGNIALGQARRWIRQGWVDVCLAGACDRSLSPMGMAGFGNLGPSPGAMTTRRVPRALLTVTATASSWGKAAPCSSSKRPPRPDAAAPNPTAPSPASAPAAMPSIASSPVPILALAHKR